MPPPKIKSFRVRPVFRLAVFLRDDIACVFCDKLLIDAKPNELTLMWLIPKAKGGEAISSNVVTCCSDCVTARNDMHWEDFVAHRFPNSLAYLKSQRRLKINTALSHSIIND